MQRHDIIDVIGREYYSSTIRSEQGEFFYPDEFKRIGRNWDDIKIHNPHGTSKDSCYENLDLRFVYAARQLTICVETKTDYLKNAKTRAQAEEQLAAYMAYERIYSGNTVIGVLASTAYNDAVYYMDTVSPGSQLTYDHIVTMEELVADLFPAFINNKENVMSATYQLNQILHGYGIEEKIRGQFVGTCLLALKNNLDFEDKNGRPRNTSSVITDIEEILKKLLKAEDKGIEKLEKVALLAKNVLKHERISKLSNNNMHEILMHIQQKILPYINDETTAGQDILNLFFTMFNKYVDKDDKNQAFTPDHITDFMCKITGVDYNSRILDPCCGSGAFLVRSLVTARNSCMKLPNKDAIIARINEEQIYGIEYSEKPYGLATTNMLIHGDGNTNVIQANCFDKKDWIQHVARPTVILMNPPYNAQKISFPEKIVESVVSKNTKTGKKDTEVLKSYCSEGWPKSQGKTPKEDPTKGLCFVEYMSDCIREAKLTNVKLAVLLPLQCAIAENGLMKRTKENLLRYNTLEAVFTLPGEMFYPGATANACCMLFTLGTPHCHTEGELAGKARKKTFFGYYKEDGFRKKKYLGRVEQLNKTGASVWETEIEPKWLELFQNNDEESGLSTKRMVTAEDEWLCEAYMKTDYTQFSEQNFTDVINDYCAYLVQNRKYPQLTAPTIFTHPLNTKSWKRFRLGDLFTIERGERIVKEIDYSAKPTTHNIYNVITTTVNNGVDGYYHRTNCQGNSIISAGEANGMFTTYQEDPCWCMDTVRIYTPIGFEMNKLRGLFLCAVLRYEMYRCSYGRKAKPSNMYPLEILLPQTDDGEPGWNAMEQYIKSLPYGSDI